MAESAIRKSLIKKFQLPGTRKGFIDEFDGNVDGLSRLQMDIESSGSEEMKQLFQEAVDNSGGDDAGIVDELVNVLYPQKTGARGKTAPVPEKVEGNLPTGAADQGTLDATPYQSLSAADKKKLNDAGYPESDISPWSAEQLQGALTSIDGTRKTGSKKTTAGKPAAKATPPAKPSPAAAATPPATPRPSAPAPAASVADVMPSREAMFSTSTDPADLLNTAQAGQTPDSELNRVLNMPPAPAPLTRADVARYVDGEGMFNEASDPIEAPPPVMDMEALGGMPTLAEVLGQMQPPARGPMDMSRLSGVPSLSSYLTPEPVDVNTLDLSGLFGEGYPPRPMQGPYRDNLFNPNEGRFISPEADPALPGTTDLMGGFAGQMQGASPFNDAGGFGSADYGPPLPPGFQRQGNAPAANTGGVGQFLPVSSRVREFWKSRPLGDSGLGGMASDAGQIASLPLAAAADAGLYAGGAALALGGAGAAMRGVRSMMGSPSAPSQEEMDELARRRDEAKAEVERAFGKFTKPAYVPPPTE
jgi:hypothetical protein